MHFSVSSFIRPAFGWVPPRHLWGISTQLTCPLPEKQTSDDSLDLHHPLNLKAIDSTEKSSDMAWIITFPMSKSRKQECYLTYKCIYVEEEDLQKNNILWNYTKWKLYKIQISVFINNFIGTWPHTHLLAIICVWFGDTTVGLSGPYRDQTAPKSLRHLFSGPLQKKFANPWSGGMKRYVVTIYF